MSLDLIRRKNDQNESYFDSVPDIIQQRVIDRFSNVAHGPLYVARGDDLMGARGVFIGGQDADLATGDLLLVNVHRLREMKQEK